MPLVLSAEDSVKIPSMGSLYCLVARMCVFSQALCCLVVPCGTKTPCASAARVVVFFFIFFKFISFKGTDIGLKNRCNDRLGNAHAPCNGHLLFAIGAQNCPTGSLHSMFLVFLCFCMGEHEASLEYECLWF